MNKETATFEEIQAEKIAIQNKRAKLIEIKAPIELELSQLTAKVRGANSYHTRLSPDEYRKTVNRQQILKKKLADVLAQMNPLKARLRELAPLENIEYKKIKVDSVKQIKNTEDVSRTQIVELRDKWLCFAEDQTRVNSMRIMAAQFARELTEILAAQIEAT